MGWVFAALGVGVVHVVVKGVLIPLLRHFKQVVFAQQCPHNARRTAHCLMKFVREGQLAAGVVVRTHEVFHDLHQHARCIVLQRRMRGVQNFIVQAAQSLQSLAGAASLQAFQQHDNSAGKAQGVRRCHFNDAVGVQARFGLAQGVILGAGVHKGVHHLDELVVLPVKQQ